MKQEGEKAKIKGIWGGKKRKQMIWTRRDAETDRGDSWEENTLQNFPQRKYEAIGGESMKKKRL